MNVKSCEKIEHSQVELTIEVGAEEFEKAIEKAYQKMRRKIRIRGFRPGKAPRQVIEATYGPEIFFDEAINSTCPDAYEEAIKEQELRVVGAPKLELVGEPSKKEGFTVKVIVAVYPEVTLGQYKGLSAPKAKVSVSDADVDERLQQLSDRNTRLVSVDREAKEGDTVIIAFDGQIDGKPFPGGSSEHHTLELGSHSFIPGFEEQVVGMKAGDERDINVTFPEDYASHDVAGKDAVFKVNVHEVKEKDIPELDDEFAKDVSEFDTLEELKTDLRKKIEEERTQEATHSFEDALMDQVAQNITADIPEAMVDNQAYQFLENLKTQIYQKGIEYDQYLTITGRTEEDLLKDAHNPALRQVRMDLAIAAIIKAENLDATAEEIEAEYKRFADEYAMDLEAVKKYLGEDQIKEQILTQKAIEVVASSATATEPEPPKEETTEEEKPSEEQPANSEETEKTEEQPAEDTKTEEVTSTADE